MLFLHFSCFPNYLSPSFLFFFPEMNFFDVWSKVNDTVRTFDISSLLSQALNFNISIWFWNFYSRQERKKIIKGSLKMKVTLLIRYERVNYFFFCDKFSDNDSCNKAILWLLRICIKQQANLLLSRGMQLPK